MTWTTYMIMGTLVLGIFIYLITRILFGWYNMCCWIVRKQNH